MFSSFLLKRSQSLFVAVALTAGVVALPQAAHAQASAPAAETAPAAATTAAAAAPIADANTVKESVDNPYGLRQLWNQGDFVAKGTLAVLVIMSIASWYILITKLYESVKISGQAKAARQGFYKATNVGEAVNTLQQGSAFRFIAENGVAASEHHEGALTQNIDRSTWVTTSVQRSIDDVQSRLQDGLAVLATVGSTAPFIGLFGTVWGILNALTTIAVAGQASIDKVAGPVGEALYMTAIGLFVAVPAVLGYNWLVRRNKVNMESVRNFGTDLHGILMGARMKSTAAAR